MNQLEAFLSETKKPINTVIHLGAGVCSELNTYINTSIENIILIEPNTQLVDRLNKKIANFPNVRVYKEAVTADGETVVFNYLSNPRFSSVLKPSGLKHFFPNILEENAEQLSTIKLTELLSKITLEPNSNHVLVTELQGIEGELLMALGDDQLQVFTQLIIQTSTELLYEGGVKKNLLVESLKRKGFKLIECDDEVTPFSFIYMLRDDNKINQDKMKRELEALEKENYYIKNLLSEEKALTNTFQKELKKIKNELASKNNDIEKLKLVSISQLEKVTELNNKLNFSDKHLQEQLKIFRSKEAEREKRKEEIIELESQLTDKNFQIEKIEHEQIQSSIKLKEMCESKDLLIADLKDKLKFSENKLQEKILQVNSLSEDSKKAKDSNIEQQKQIADKNVQIESLEIKLNETSKEIEELKFKYNDRSERQLLLDKELVKAEAQIELIKDVLLREKSL